MFILIISQPSMNMVMVGSKSRSLGQILVKSCYHTTGHNFDPIFIKLAQSVYIDGIYVEFEHKCCQVKKQVTRSNLIKILVTTLQAIILTQSSSNLLRMFTLMISRSSLNISAVRPKSRSLGQILEESYYQSRGHNFDPIFIKLAQNVYLDNVWNKFQHGKV